MKQIRLTKENEKELSELVRGSNNDLLTIPKAANRAIKVGLPKVRKKYFKNGK